MKLKSIEYRNFWAVGSTPIKIDLDGSQLTVCIGKNGAGKCLSKSTVLEIKNEPTEAFKKFEQFIKNKGNDK